MNYIEVNLGNGVSNARKVLTKKSQMVSWSITSKSKH